MTKERLNLVVFETSNGEFLADCEDDPETVDELYENNKPLTFVNALSIGEMVFRAVGGSPNQPPPGDVRAPSLGTVHWCVMEPVTRIKVRPQAYYWIKDLSEMSQKVFTAEYSNYLAALKDTLNKRTNLIQSAPPEALRQIENLAKQAGITKEAALNAIIHDSMDAKLRNGTIR